MILNAKVPFGTMQGMLNRFNSMKHPFFWEVAKGQTSRQVRKSLFEEKLEGKWSRRRGSNPHGLAATGF
jgi:hypothetical protein